MQLTQKLGKLKLELMTFEDAVNLILEYEGGYVFDSNDPGGETKWGISKRVYPQWDIKNLTKEKAKAIYKVDYWDVVQAEKLPQSIRLMIFDCAVNQGQRTARIILQKALGVKADGVLGPITLGAIKDLEEMQLIDRVAKIRLDYYTSLPHWDRFGKGWAKRLLGVSLLCAFLADVKIKRIS